jgi:hypothetical protein
MIIMKPSAVTPNAVSTAPVSQSGTGRTASKAELSRVHEESGVS